MPLIDESSYRPPLFLSNAHFQTVFPSLFRRVDGVRYRRERVSTSDDDFVDLDISETGSAGAAIVLHGLEGDSGRAYMRGMARALNRGGWDAVAFNFRGCSGEPNRRIRFYHSGDTGDLAEVIAHVAAGGNYRRLALVGFSLGGNVLLKYLGERGERVHPSIVGAAAFSVPCDLMSSSLKLAEPANRPYMRRFLRMLHEKIRLKMRTMPGLISDDGYHLIRNFKDFDDRYTAPVHGFESAEDYWLKSSCRRFLPEIRVPTLIVSAADDPFLGESCYPLNEARENRFLFLEIPPHGGHVGFVSFQRDGEYWSESRCREFLNDI